LLIIKIVGDVKGKQEFSFLGLEIRWCDLLSGHHRQIL